MKTPIHREGMDQIDSAFETFLKSEKIMNDGAICPERYTRSGLRVMWVLKAPSGLLVYESAGGIGRKLKQSLGIG